MDFPTAPLAVHPSTMHPPASPIAVLVVDDQRAVREGLARLITSTPLALRIIATAATAAEALRLAAQLRPELVLLDVDLAGEDGLALISQLAPARVLVLSCHGDRATRERAARMGARAFVEKHQPAADLLAAVVNLATPGPWEEKAPGGSGVNALPAPVASSDAHAHSRP